ncbi:hypothetical protein BN1012_Phect2421 [Candidatus Phaeomarinobacter ectocarpi]|uniref:Uncharacterized protein n=1 Tax=Candidatus Phaeomarinibacter ectocarpi TaxID=1458461 RepID=X5MGK6_9HYPH|nr:hypothetical protein BN1012_Phect2421 [Candidatus Phaeomarinobacter ectocarpi]
MSGFLRVFYAGPHKPSFTAFFVAHRSRHAVLLGFAKYM